MEKVKIEFELGAPHASLLLKLTELTLYRSPSALARALLEAMFDADSFEERDAEAFEKRHQLPN